MTLVGRLRRLFTRLAARPHRPMSPEAIGSLVLRDAGPADLRRLAQLHVDTFNETHVGPMGSGPSLATRESQWRGKLQELHATNFVLVLETPEGELVGFAWVHPTSDEATYASRLNKIYLRRGYQRRGLGTRLMKAAVDRLLANGVTSMQLFTETDNVPACAFYEKLGAMRVPGENGKFEGMYAWPDLRLLRQRLGP